MEAVVVDGHVYVDNDLKYGLGGYVWESLEKQVPVIGVAKKDFYANKETTVPVLRGDSKMPLFISAVGMDREEAVEKIKNMKGDFRFPAILKELDRLTRQ